MNNSIVNPASNNAGKRVWFHYVTAAAGLALAVSALAALTQVKGQGSPQATTGGGARQVWVSNSPQSVHQVLFYLVSSEEQADQVRRNEELAQWVRLDNGVPEPNRSLGILVAGTARDEEQAQEKLNSVASELAAAGVAMQIQDLRGR